MAAKEDVKVLAERAQQVPTGRWTPVYGLCKRVSVPLGLGRDQASTPARTQAKGNGCFVLRRKVDAYNIDTFVRLYFK